MNKENLVNVLIGKVENLYEMLGWEEIDVDKFDLEIQDIIGTAYCCGKLDEYFLPKELKDTKNEFIAEIFE